MPDYVNGDPVNLVDPDGHTPCEEDSLCAQDRGRPLPFQDSVLAHRPNYHGAKPQIRTIPLPSEVSGHGRVEFRDFISGSKACLADPVLCNNSDNRGFDPGAPDDRSKVVVIVDYDQSTLTIRVNPSCNEDHTQCNSALPLKLNREAGGFAEVDSRAEVSVDKGRLVVKGSFANAKVQLGFIPLPAKPIKFDLRFGTDRQDRDVVDGTSQDFPSAEAYEFLGGALTTIFQYRQNPGGPINLMYDDTRHYRSYRAGDGGS